MKRKMLGKHIVIDPDICHGKPTFVGTRIMVWQVLNRLADNKSWDEISWDWDGRISHEAIREVIQLAGRAFLDHAGEYGHEAESA